MSLALSLVCTLQNIKTCNNSSTIAKNVFSQVLCVARALSPVFQSELDIELATHRRRANALRTALRIGRATAQGRGLMMFLRLAIDERRRKLMLI